MPVERVFIKKGLKWAELEEFLERELERAGYGGMELRRTPTGTRVTLYVERPGLVIGRKGRSIQQLTDELGQKFGIDKPQIEVLEIDVPELSAPIVAKRVAFSLSRGRYFRRVGYGTLRRIMQAGARGAEIVVSGKLRGEHARFERFYDGYLKKAGEPALKLVSTGYAIAKLKAGVLGVKVRIMPPDVKLPDEIGFVKKEKAEEIAGEAEVAEEKPLEEKPKEKKGKPEKKPEEKKPQKKEEKPEEKPGKPKEEKGPEEKLEKEKPEGKPAEERPPKKKEKPEEKPEEESGGEPKEEAKPGEKGEPGESKEPSEEEKVEVKPPEKIEEKPQEDKVEKKQLKSEKEKTPVATSEAEEGESSGDTQA
jgi:small subunit ribosomal protein S3